MVHASFLSRARYCSSKLRNAAKISLHIGDFNARKEMYAKSGPYFYSCLKQLLYIRRFHMVISCGSLHLKSMHIPESGHYLPFLSRIDSVVRKLEHARGFNVTSMTSQGVSVSARGARGETYLSYRVSLRYSCPAPKESRTPVAHPNRLSVHGFLKGVARFLVAR